MKASHSPLQGTNSSCLLSEFPLHQHRIFATDNRLQERVYGMPEEVKLKEATGGETDGE